MRVSLPTICILMVALWGCGTEPSAPGDETSTKKASDTKDAQPGDAQPANAPLPEIRYYVLADT